MSNGAYAWSVRPERQVASLDDRQAAREEARIRCAGSKEFRMFYEGDLQGGIALALRDAKRVVCFIRGMR